MSRDTDASYLDALSKDKSQSEALLKTGALQHAIFNSANFSSIATDANGVIQIFNVGAERMLGYSASDVINKVTPADLSEPEELDARATTLSIEFATPITPGFEALVFKASRGIEDIYELTYVRKDRSRFPAVVSVTALRDAEDVVIGYLLIGTDNTARKHAEEALLENYALLRTIHLHSIVSVTDRAGVIIDANDGFCKISGYPRDELVGQTHRIVNSGVQSPAFWQQMWQTIADGLPWRGEICNRTKDGALYWVDSIIAPFKSEDGRTKRYISVRTDVTARKLAEEALLKAGALQRAIFNSANFSSIATDANGVIQIFNVGAERMLGYQSSDVLNKITPADISDPQELIARASALSLELGTPITPGFEALVFKASRGIEDIYELTYLRKDGTRLPAVVSVTALRDPQEAIIGYLLIGTDNTARQHVEEERMRLEQRLRDQHFYTRSLIESNIDALMTTDPQGIITDINKQMEGLTGCTRDELIGAPFKTFFTDASRAEAGINRVLNEGKVTNYELTARSRDGTLTVVSYNASTFHDRGRRLQGVFAAARDVTELKRIERALQQKNHELEDASRMKSEFLANMSHELRTPLNAIMGFSEVLKEGLVGGLSERQRGLIVSIFGSGEHLLAVINDILDLSKVEAGKMSLDLEPVPLSTLFANSLSIIRAKAAARRIVVTLDASADLGAIEADARKLKQMLYNLLSNAVKFTQDGGQVTLQARRVSRADVGREPGGWSGRTFPLADSEFADFIHVSVTDNGLGISPDGMTALFKPFSQIDSGLARKFEGTGLGLALVKVLAELHGGTLAVASAPGEGSRFSIWLPARQVASPRAEPVRRTPAVANAVAGSRIALMVEDDLNSAELVRLQLEAEGFSVLHATSGEAALELAAQHTPSLITLDIMLPAMDGWEFLARLKQLPALMMVPVVIISIVAERNKGVALGAAAVMHKPMSRQELSDSLRELGLLPVIAGKTLKVLVVDDDPNAVELTAVRIEELASTVLRAYGGLEAIAVARRELPDLMILDLMMPEVNGFDVVSELSQDPATARIPIMVITAKQITGEDRARLSGYVTSILEKASFRNDQFIGEVRRAMSGRRAVG